MHWVFVSIIYISHNPEQRNIAQQCDSSTLPPLSHSTPADQECESLSWSKIQYWCIRSSMRRSFLATFQGHCIEPSCSSSPPAAAFPKNQKLLSVGLSNQTTHYIGYFKFLSGKFKTLLLQALSLSDDPRINLFPSFSMSLLPYLFELWFWDFLDMNCWLVNNMLTVCCF